MMVEDKKSKKSKLWKYRVLLGSKYRRPYLIEPTQEYPVSTRSMIRLKVMHYGIW